MVISLYDDKDPLEQVSSDGEKFAYSGDLKRRKVFLSVEAYSSDEEVKQVGTLLVFYTVKQKLSSRAARLLHLQSQGFFSQELLDLLQCLPTKELDSKRTSSLSWIGLNIRLL